MDLKKLTLFLSTAGIRRTLLYLHNHQSMSTAALSADHTLYYQLRNNGHKATEINIDNETELTHTGKTPNDVFVLLRKVPVHASTAQGSHLTVQICGQSYSDTSSSASCKRVSPPPPSVTVGVIKLCNSVLLGGFSYLDVFMDNLYTARSSSDSKVLCAVDSSGLFWDTTQRRVTQWDTLRFSDADVLTLLATHTAHDLSFSLAINGVIKPLFFNFHLVPTTTQERIVPLFFIQFNNAGIRIIGDITTAHNSLPDPRATFSLLSYSLQDSFGLNLATSLPSKPELAVDEPPGLCTQTSLTPTVPPTMAFSTAPQQLQPPVPPSEKTICKDTAEKPSTKPAMLHSRATTAKQLVPPISRASSGVEKTVELSNIYGFGKQMGNHTVYTDDSIIFAEIDLGMLNIRSTQKPAHQYNFSTTATITKLDEVDAPQFSLAVFSLVKSLGSAISMVINTHSPDIIKPSVRLLCVHKEVLKVLPSCILFPVLLSSTAIESEIPSIESSGLYDFLVSDNGVEVRSHQDKSGVRIDRFIIKTVDMLSQLFDKEFYDKMVSSENNFVNGQSPAEFHISSYAICISVNTACVSVLQPKDQRRMDILSSPSNAQIPSWFSLTQLSTPLAWLRAAEAVHSMADGGSYSGEFRFLRNALGFLGFVDLSYRIATIDTEGVAVTTPIPVLDPQVSGDNELETPVSIYGVSMPKGCTLQLVSYGLSKDKKLGGNKNIIQEYFLNPPGKSPYLDYSTFNRGVYQSEAIKTYEFLYKAVFSKRDDKHPDTERVTSMNTALKHALDKLLSHGTQTNLLGAAIEHLNSPDYLYDVFISRELDRVQSPVRSSVLRHACSFHTNDKEERTSTTSLNSSAEIWNRLKATVEAGVPFWIFFDEITAATSTKSVVHDQDFMVTSNASSFTGREFLIVAHRVRTRILYVLYVDGMPSQTVLTTRSISVMLTFDSPWAMSSKYYLCKSPTYSPNYLRLTSWKECFQKPLPFTPYLPSRLEMIPLTSSLNLEIGSSTTSSNAESLSLYNNAANKMSHWESLLFVGSNSLVTPQTTNIYISIYSPYNADDDNLSILHHSLVRQYGSKSPRGSYEEGNYISLVASQYRQRVPNHVGTHKFNTRGPRKLDIDTIIANLSKKDIEKVPRGDHIISNISMYRLGRVAKADLLTNITNQYYVDSYSFDGMANPLLEDRSIERLKRSIHAIDSYRLSWQDLREALGGLYDEPVLLFLCIGHCIDYTHMFNTEELFSRENDMGTIVWNLLLLIFGGGGIHRPCTPVVNFLINGINEKADRMQNPNNEELLISGNAGPIRRHINPKSLLDISFPPNILRDEYRSFYNYDKLCYVYTSNAFEAYHFGETSKLADLSQDTKTTGTVSLAPTCNPPASVYVRFEYVYVPRMSSGSIDEVLLNESERVNKVVDDLYSIRSGQDDSVEPSFPQFELISARTSKPLYAPLQPASAAKSVLCTTSQGSGSTIQLSSKPANTFLSSVKDDEGADKDASMYAISNNGYAVDATKLGICVLLSEMLPNRPLYSHCLKIVVKFQGKYGRFMIDRYSSSFSCARFTGDDRGKKKYMELHGEMRVTIILDYKQMFIFMFLQDLLSSSQTNAQRVPWKINWPVRFMVLLHYASAEITTLEN